MIKTNAGLPVSQFFLNTIKFYEYEILKQSVTYTNYLFILEQAKFMVQELKTVSARLSRDPFVHDRTRLSLMTASKKSRNDLETKKIGYQDR